MLHELNCLKRYSTLTILFLLFIFSGNTNAQQESKQKKLKFQADARIRGEQDWNSRKSDGTYRDDRFRVRFRVRAGLKYRPKEWAEFGIRFRTGYPEKQQDPHLTIGDGYHEFESVPIGFDKLYFRMQYFRFDFWIGRNTFPFEKKHELFWGDNVWLDGFYLGASFDTAANWIDSVKYSGGLFTVINNFSTFSSDSFIGMLRVSTKHLDKRLSVFPSFYYFAEMPDIPDGNENYRFDYAIFHFGAEYIMQQPRMIFGLDFYQNLKNYQSDENIPEFLKNQKSGVVGHIVWGELKKKGDFSTGVYLTYLERYAAVDFFAQNDWTRWDYSSQGSRDGRLTNFKGVELVAAYKISKLFQLKMRYFKVEQLLPYGSYLETGDRIRLDLDFKW